MLEASNNSGEMSLVIERGTAQNTTRSDQVLCRLFSSVSFRRKLREAKTTPTRLMLCLSLILSMTFYLTGIDQTSSRWACIAFAGCIHYFTLVALMWMGVEGAYLYRNIVLVAMNPARHMFKICCLLAWGRSNNFCSCAEKKACFEQLKAVI